jgi:SPP1 gp7 family putative phage head morphogenesis protein
VTQYPATLDIAVRRARPSLVDAIEDLVAVRASGGADDAYALERFAAVLGSTLLYGDLVGRYQTLAESDAARAGRRARLAADIAPLIEVPFRRAIEDLVSREPRLVADREELSRLYQSERVFGLARSADLTITQRVQDLLREAMEKAGPGVDATTVAIQSAGDFARAYAETVLRTNFATAYSDGRITKAMEPAVRAVTPALRFTAIRDSRVRHNHLAADGLVAAPDDPVWDSLRPPLGYLCRCRLDLVSVEEAERMGILDRAGNVRPARIPQGAYPDPGFRVAA